MWALKRAKKILGFSTCFYPKFIRRKVMRPEMFNKSHPTRVAGIPSICVNLASSLCPYWKTQILANPISGRTTTGENIDTRTCKQVGWKHFSAPYLLAAWNVADSPSANEDMPKMVPKFPVPSIPQKGHHQQTQGQQVVLGSVAAVRVLESMLSGSSCFANIQSMLLLFRAWSAGSKIVPFCNNHTGTVLRCTTPFLHRGSVIAVVI